MPWARDLRIIYGPEHLLPENLERLRSRSVSTKRSLALREFALGIEALERFVRKEPLRRVHECVFGVLALESARAKIIGPLLPCVRYIITLLAALPSNCWWR